VGHLPHKTQGKGTPVELLKQYITTTGHTTRYLRIHNAKEFTSIEMVDFYSENEIILQPVVAAAAPRMHRPLDEREDASREGMHGNNTGSNNARRKRQGHIIPKRDYEALWKYPTVATRATNPHAAALARRPGTMD